MSEAEESLGILLDDKRNIEQVRWGNLVSCVLLVSMILFSLMELGRHVRVWGWNTIKVESIVDGVTYQVINQNPYYSFIGTCVLGLFLAVIIANQLIIRKSYYITCETIFDLKEELAGGVEHEEE